MADARATLEELLPLMDGWRTSESYRERVAGKRRRGTRGGSHSPHRDAACSVRARSSASRRALSPRDVVLNAAGSLPGDLHKLWRARDPKQYHLEYGYSCMGYEIAAGLGVKMAAHEREVYVLVGDGSYLMMAQEIVTSIQEGVR